MVEEGITLFLTERLMWYSFVLIVGIEFFILRRYLSGLNGKKAFFISLKTNILSMLFLVPLAWGICVGIMLCLRFFVLIIWGMNLVVMTVLPEFLSQYITSDIFETILGAPLILHPQFALLAEWVMAPAYFLVSYYGEYLFCRRNLKEYERETIKKAFFYANLWSYAAIMLVESVYQLFFSLR